MDIKEDFSSMVFKFYENKSASGSGIKSMSNQLQLPDELHQPIIKNFLKRVYSSLKDNIWGTYLAHMQLISKYNKGIRHLLCAIYLFRKYAWVVSL